MYSYVRKNSDGTVAWVSSITNCANEARWITDSTCKIDNNFSKVLKQVFQVEKKNIFAYLKYHRRDRDKYLQR